MGKDKKQQTEQEKVATEEILEQEVKDVKEEIKENEEIKEENDEKVEIVDETQEKIKSLEAELEKKSAEAAEFKDKWIRTVADMENLRKRTAVEKQDSLKYANTNIITDLLVILDDFERAIEAGKSETFDKDGYIAGVEMIEKQFGDLLFKKYGVVKYGETGEDFDPNIHQAMMMIEGDYEKEVLANVFRKGYMLHDRVIRPAQVQVGKPTNK